VAWYRRTFTIPEAWKEQHVVLHFGAVDYLARVWVNGQPVGEHEGGYTPFEFDITDVLAAGDNTVAVRVDDPADLSEIPHGKQSSIPANPWDDVDFTTVSGIWQTVWLEARPAAYITQAHITPDVSNERAMLAVVVECPHQAAWSSRSTSWLPMGARFRRLKHLRLTQRARTRLT
jgi:beta-galactosidase/beta-glucuronidase